jgi:hypothetical protein
VATLMLERRPFFPHDLYQAALLVYLVAASESARIWVHIQTSRVDTHDCRKSIAGYAWI